MTGLSLDLGSQAQHDLLTASFVRAREIGILGPSPIASQMAHALRFAEAVEQAVYRRGRPQRRGRGLELEVVDLGAGAGLPGLVMAGAWPNARVTLVEAAARRARHLRHTIQRCGWEERVSVVEGRAEEVGREAAYRQRFAVAVARSFAKPAVTAECAAPLLERDGLLVVSDPPSTGTGAGERWPAQPLKQLGLVMEGRFLLGELNFTALRQSAPCPDRFPRRTGVPSKRPLF